MLKNNFTISKVEYLYDLTLRNYISKKILEDNPIFDTLLINFLKDNFTLITNKSNDLIYKFILYLHYELDFYFYKLPKKDVLHQLEFEISLNNFNRLKMEVKKLADKISESYIQIKKKN